MLNSDLVQRTSQSSDCTPLYAGKRPAARPQRRIVGGSGTVVIDNKQLQKAELVLFAYVTQ